jgi:hypothetical protein
MFMWSNLSLHFYFLQSDCMLLHVFYIILNATFLGSRRGGNAKEHFYLQEGWIDVAEEIDDLFSGDAEVI